MGENLRKWGTVGSQSTNGPYVQPYSTVFRCPAGQSSERRVASFRAQSGMLASHPTRFTWQVGDPYKEPKASWSRLPDGMYPSQ